MRPATALMLSEEQKQLRDTVEALARDHFSPKAAEWDRHRTVLPDAERKLLAELDLLGITHLADVGGSDRPLMDALIVIEELAKHAPSAAFPVFESNTGPARVVDLLGTAEQRERFLPPVIRGEVTIAVSISEPEAGSAATDIRTTARVTGEEVVINGTKRWCTGAGHAEQYLVYARIDTGNGEPKIGAVILDRDAPDLGPIHR